MKTYFGVSSFKGVGKPILTTGTFDGVHIGHRHIINRIKQLTDEIGGETVLLTFEPHPRMVLFPDDHDLKLLNTPAEKQEQLAKAGIEHLVIHPFTREFSKKSAMEYVRELLVDGIAPYRIVVGYDHHFGKNREGDFSLLQEYGEMLGFGVEEIPAQMIDEVNVSSTKIRKALEKGDLATANSYLGYNYPLTGIVIEGDRLGRTIGFPTANLAISHPHKLIPAKGVYAVRVEIDKKWYNAMLNIGNRPTVKDAGELRIEVHILNIEMNLYGKELKIEMLDWIRGEKRFENLDKLTEQLELDRKEVIRRIS